jgi:large subunit ribosomal protein L22
MSAKNEFGNRANVVHLNGIRIAPRKLRLLIDLIRNKPVSEALRELRFSDKAAAKDVAKLLESGVANIREVLREWNPDELVVKTAFVDSGVTLKRFAPRAQGRASSIMKRSSRVTIELRPE